MMDKRPIKVLKNALKYSPNDPQLNLQLYRFYSEQGQLSDYDDEIRSMDIDLLIVQPIEHRLEWARLYLTLGLNDIAARLSQMEPPIASASLDPSFDDLNTSVGEFSTPKSQSNHPVLSQKNHLRLIDSQLAYDKPDYQKLFEHTEYYPSHFTDIGGLDHVKQALYRSFVLPLKKPDIYHTFKRRFGGSLLVYGPPGCGKTLLAKGLAKESNSSFFEVPMADMLDMYIGEAEKRLHFLFEQVREARPSIVFIDEFDVLGHHRLWHHDNNHSKIISQFLLELDSHDKKNQGILVLGATSNPWKLDPALLRPGRFEQCFFIPPPPLKARAHILTNHLKYRPHNQDIDVTLLAKLTALFSGADLIYLVDKAIEFAIDESLAISQIVPLNHNHLIKAFQHCHPTTLTWLKEAEAELKNIPIDFHFNELKNYLMSLTTRLYSTGED